MYCAIVDEPTQFELHFIRHSIDCNLVFQLEFPFVRKFKLHVAMVWVARNVCRFHTLFSNALQFLENIRSISDSTPSTWPKVRKLSRKLFENGICTSSQCGLCECIPNMSYVKKNSNEKMHFVDASCLGIVVANVQQQQQRRMYSSAK